MSFLHSPASIIAAEVNSFHAAMLLLVALCLVLSGHRCLPPWPRQRRGLFVAGAAQLCLGCEG